MIARRRLLLMRHGEVEYFTSEGKPLPPADLKLTARGIAQARAVGRLLAHTRIRLDRVWTSGMPRTHATAAEVLAGMDADIAVRHESRLEEIRPGRLSDIARDQLERAFIAPFEGAVPPATSFLGGETIGELLDRVLPAMRTLLADEGWDTALLVAHGGVNRALLSWFLTGEAVFLGGLAQDPGCLNIVDIGPRPSQTVVRVVNFCPLEPLQDESRAATMEQLLQQYLYLTEHAATGKGQA